MPVTDKNWKIVTDKDGAQFFEIPVQSYIPPQNPYLPPAAPEWLQRMTRDALDIPTTRGLSPDFVVMDEAYETVNVVNNEGDVVRSEPVNPLIDESQWMLANPSFGRVPPTERAATRIGELLDAFNIITGVSQNPPPLRTIGGIPFATSPDVPQGMFLTIRPPGGTAEFPVAFRNTPEPQPRGRFQNLDWDDE